MKRYLLATATQPFISGGVLGMGITTLATFVYLSFSSVEGQYRNIIIAAAGTTAFFIFGILQYLVTLLSIKVASSGVYKGCKTVLLLVNKENNVKFGTAFFKWDGEIYEVIIPRLSSDHDFEFPVTVQTQIDSVLVRFNLTVRVEVKVSETGRLIDGWLDPVQLVVFIARPKYESFQAWLDDELQSRLISDAHLNMAVKAKMTSQEFLWADKIRAALDELRFSPSDLPISHINCIDLKLDLGSVRAELYRKFR